MSASVRDRPRAGNAWLTDQPAAIRRRVGKGTITCLGAAVDQPLTQTLAKQWTALAKIDSPVIAVPDREVFILTNFSAGPQEIAPPATMTDVLNGGEVTEIALPRYGVAVLLRRLRAGL
jgi:beta-galactosidase